MSCIIGSWRYTVYTATDWTRSSERNAPREGNNNNNNWQTNVKWQNCMRIFALLISRFFFFCFAFFLSFIYSFTHSNWQIELVDFKVLVLSLQPGLSKQFVSHFVHQCCLPMDRINRKIRIRFLILFITISISPMIQIKSEFCCCCQWENK